MSFVLLTDCDLGDPFVERDVLAAAGIDLVEASCRTEDEVVEAGRGAVGLLVQYAQVGARAFEELGDLRAVARYGVGLDSIDLDAATRSGVSVCSVPDYCTNEVADHTLALLLALTRGVADAVPLVRAGRWPAAASLGPLAALSDLTVGLIGVGRVGRAVAARCQAFGAQVYGHDPHIDDAELGAAGIEPVSLEAAFGCDVVSLHLPLTEATQGIVCSSTLALMPPGAILLNVSRGGLVDEAALLAALEEGHVGGAGLDVLVDEPPPLDARLFAHPRVLVTPHVAFYSPNALTRLRRGAAEQLVSALAEPRPVAA